MYFNCYASFNGYVKLLETPKGFVWTVLGSFYYGIIFYAWQVKLIMLLIGHKCYGMERYEYLYVWICMACLVEL